MTAETENQIAAYQPNETIRLVGLLENEPVWLTQSHTGASSDRFPVIDGKEFYLIGAALKVLGGKCFGFASLGISIIPDNLAEISGW